ncbi:hypothetical protein L6452_33151 [Arctium lappa]|uniref:Uncharacterized protein n=1 Tax=Arctium lappa TaxID=4217 RepID=A0ACB8Z758_ARCLA|nr:hypothetical protein L6452_33151 [Arctium lappa]
MNGIFMIPSFPTHHTFAQKKWKLESIGYTLKSQHSVLEAIHEESNQNFRSKSPPKCWIMIKSPFGYEFFQRINRQFQLNFF